MHYTRIPFLLTFHLVFFNCECSLPNFYYLNFISFNVGLEVSSGAKLGLNILIDWLISSFIASAMKATPKEL